MRDDLLDSVIITMCALLVFQHKDDVPAVLHFYTDRSNNNEVNSRSKLNSVINVIRGRGTRQPVRGEAETLSAEAFVNLGKV